MTKATHYTESDDKITEINYIVKDYFTGLQSKSLGNNSFCMPSPPRKTKCPFPAKSGLGEAPSTETSTGPQIQVYITGWAKAEGGKFRINDCHKLRGLGSPSSTSIVAVAIHEE